MVALKYLAPFAIAASLVASSARAEAIVIDNHSFEASNLSPGASVTGSVPGWSIEDDNSVGVWRPTTGVAGAFDNVPDGDYIGYVYGAAILYQDLNAELAANTFYTLTLSYGGRRDLGPGNTYSFIVGLAADGVTLEERTLTADSTSLGIWDDFSFDFQSALDVAGGQQLSIFIRNAGHSGYFDNIQLDALELESPVETPEPAALGLLGLGLAGIGLTRRRRT